jgi:hypothetical protein
VSKFAASLSTSATGWGAFLAKSVLSPIVSVTGSAVIGYIWGRILRGIRSFIGETPTGKLITTVIRWGTYITAPLSGVLLTLTAFADGGMTFTTVAIIKALMPLLYSLAGTAGFAVGDNSKEITKLTKTVEDMIPQEVAEAASGFVDFRFAKRRNAY